MGVSKRKSGFLNIDNANRETQQEKFATIFIIFKSDVRLEVVRLTKLSRNENVKPSKEGIPRCGRSAVFIFDGEFIERASAEVGEDRASNVDSIGFV